MMKTGQKRVNPQSPLYEAVLQLRTKEECFAFFQDLCTASECKAMEQRFEVARLLDKGMIYTEILEKTGASTATISRVGRSLNDYGTGAYRMVFDRMDGKE